jgi:hypothetical protein
LSEVLTHVSRPFCRYAGIHIEDGKNRRHLQIHNATTHKANHEKDWTGDLKYFNLAIVEHVSCQSDREENTEYRYRQDGDSNGKKEKGKMKKIFVDFLLPKRPVISR